MALDRSAEHTACDSGVAVRRWLTILNESPDIDQGSCSERFKSVVWSVGMTYAGGSALSNRVY